MIFENKKLSKRKQKYLLKCFGVELKWKKKQKKKTKKQNHKQLGAVVCVPFTWMCNKQTNKKIKKNNKKKNNNKQIKHPFSFKTTLQIVYIVNI